MLEHNLPYYRVPDYLNSTIIYKLFGRPLARLTFDKLVTFGGCLPFRSSNQIIVVRIDVVSSGNANKHIARNTVERAAGSLRRTSPEGEELVRESGAVYTNAPTLRPPSPVQSTLSHSWVILITEGKIRLNIQNNNVIKSSCRPINIHLIRRLGMIYICDDLTKPILSIHAISS